MDLRQLLNADETRSQSTRVSKITGLLNPDNRPVDVLSLVNELATFTANRELLVPFEIQNHLNLVLSHLRENTAARQTTAQQNNSTFPGALASRTLGPTRQETRKVKLNRVTTLDVLYTYPIDTVLEYPETSSTGFVGHLFHMDPNNWGKPILNIAYSRGKPSGQTIAGNEVTTDILRDHHTKEKVPCVHGRTTCQGSKACPFTDLDSLSLPHTAAMREDVKERLQNDRENRKLFSSPSKDVFMRTVGYLAAIKKLGCSRPLSEETFLLATEEEERETRQIYLQQIRRGYRVTGGICEGQLVFGYDEDERAYICCEHYIPGQSKDHFRDMTIGSGGYDLDYIEAVIGGDVEEALRIEDEAGSFGYGPSIECTTVANFSTQMAYCPVTHRDAQDNLVQPLLEHLPCTSQFRVYEPLESHRANCPFILIVTSGAHSHPVPLPTKTPPHIRTTLMNLLKDLGDDLPDLTPRRLLRHPIVKTFLSKTVPNIVNPTLADWHVSFANRAHLKAYIKQARELHYPFGTGWAGVVNLKAHQDAHLPKEQHYIRRILAIEMDHAVEMDEDEDEIVNKADNQFEVAGMERDANTSIIYLRVFLNRMSAFAHQRVFEEIESIVFEDTKKRLKWHHIHASNDDDGLDRMVLSWVGDQHRGQAKGLGLHLQKVAAQMPPKADLYQSGRNIQDLTPYEHLHHIFRVCVVHYFRLVKLCATTENVRWLMRSLVCMEHPDWDGTLESIRQMGGKAAQDWLSNKQSSGLQKAQQFDSMKMKTLKAYEDYGIKPTYKTGNLFENAVTNIRRREYYMQSIVKLELERDPSKRLQLQHDIEKKIRTESKANEALDKARILIYKCRIIAQNYIQVISPRSFFYASKILRFLKWNPRSVQQVPMSLLPEPRKIGLQMCDGRIQSVQVQRYVPEFWRLLRTTFTAVNMKQHNLIWRNTEYTLLKINAGYFAFNNNIIKLAGVVIMGLMVDAIVEEDWGARRALARRSLQQLSWMRDKMEQRILLKALRMYQVLGMLWQPHMRTTRSGAVFSAYFLGAGGFDFAPHLSQAVAAEGEAQEDHESDDVEWPLTDTLNEVDSEWPPADSLNEVDDILVVDVPVQKRRRSASFNDCLASGRPLSGPHRRRKVKRDKARAANGHIPAASTVRKHLKLAEPVSMPSFDASTLPTAHGAYGGKAESKPEKQGRTVSHTLKELLGLGLQLIRWNGIDPIPLVDNKHRIFAVLAGQPTANGYGDSVSRAFNFIKSKGNAARFPASMLQHRRGLFAVVNVGLTFGPGQFFPTWLDNKKYTLLADQLLAHQDIGRMAAFASGSLSAMFQLWAPRLFSYYREYNEKLSGSDMWSHLRRPFPNSVFSCAAFNFGPRVCTFKHRDVCNLPFGWCAIQSLGNFDATVGGHLVLWDANLVVEFPAGALILLPSATIAHSNVPVCDHEERISFTQFTAGNLFRFVDNGFQTQDQLAAAEPEKYARLMKLKDTRWEEGLKLFSTIEEMLDDAKEMLDDAK
ncbi:hypothetical protein C8R45DRAFT_933970 [Mycena sanguinolenta]|nr:hypothetical protein C8R45DRAFT_933970 [Mycena sanguinolenta]